MKQVEDMDVRPRHGSLKKKPRPKSMHRDVMESPKPPARATGNTHTLRHTHIHYTCSCYTYISGGC